eukprot:2382865-Karenia_brevis.AAC.1
MFKARVLQHRIFVFTGVANEGTKMTQIHENHLWLGASAVSRRHHTRFPSTYTCIEALHSGAAAHEYADHVLKQANAFFRIENALLKQAFLEILKRQAITVSSASSLPLDHPHPA